MAIKTVIKMGNQALATPSLPVEDFSKLSQLLNDMQDTMRENFGAGIAAPQIGYNQRVIMYEVEHNRRYPNEASIPFTILINPVLEALSDEMIDGWEGCLSVPGLRGLVSRYSKIKYTAFDPNGNPLSGIAEGFHARVLQHECDHLDGILYPRRIKDLRFFGYEDSINF